MKLGLGTAQFGQVYGIANAGKGVPDDIAADILDFAGNHAIDLIDTAADYGSCETLLGNVGIDPFAVVTKMPGIPTGVDDIQDWVCENVGGSLQRMHIGSLYGLLLHRPGELLGADGDTLFQALVREKAAGRVGKIGVSVYSPAELEAITRRFDVDMVQLPCNVLDRRFLESGWMDKLMSAGVEIHVRSAFLQGLLLMDALPAYFDRWREKIGKWHAWLADEGIDPVSACLAFLKSLPGIDRIIVGATTVIQLEHIVDSFNSPLACRFPDIGSLDEALVNPSQWVLT